jgi:CBS domain-containing protein/ribosome-associated translation inhibitor RaiA
MRLDEIMTTTVVTIEAKQPADVAWSRMQRHRIRHLVVLDGAHLVGMVSERDLGGRSGATLRRGRTVEELMTASLVGAQPKTTLRQAANLMRARKIGSLPILDGDRLMGIVTATDVLDELGRGSSRPAVRAARRVLRLPAGSRHRGGRPIARPRPRVPGKTRRARGRQPDNPKRAPFADRLAKSRKREPGPKEASRVPAHIRVVGVALTADDRTYIRRKLGMKLGKFATSIERVSVRVEDVNGPRGGVDQECRIKVVLSGLPSVVFEAKDASLDAAVDGALSGIERAVRRSLQRRRSRRNARRD